MVRFRMIFRALLVSVSAVAALGCLLLPGNALSSRLEQRENVRNLTAVTPRAPQRANYNDKESKERDSYVSEPVLPFHMECENERCRDTIRVAWRMVVFIKSTASNFYRRSLIRRTWGKWRHVDEGLLRVVFVTGTPDSERVRHLLEEESLRNGDVINFNGSDSYRNIATKTLTGMRWAVDHLPDHYLYSSGDDDFLVDLGALQEAMMGFVEEYDVHDAHRFPIICTYSLLDDAQVVRNRKSKWYVSEGEYRWDTFPRACLGGLYTTTVGVARQLLEASEGLEPMRVDDVWITGILREKLFMPDDLVVAPQRPVAKHFVGYRGKRSKNIRGYMLRDWNKIYDKFKHKRLCTCDGSN